jgi:hypothetical protein
VAVIADPTMPLSAPAYPAAQAAILVEVEEKSSGRSCTPGFIGFCQRYGRRILSSPAAFRTKFRLWRKTRCVKVASVSES